MATSFKRGFTRLSHFSCIARAAGSRSMAARRINATPTTLVSSVNTDLASESGGEVTANTPIAFVED
jgi:hypothetical protein